MGSTLFLYWLLGIATIVAVAIALERTRTRRRERRWSVIGGTHRPRFPDTRLTPRRRFPRSRRPVTPRPTETMVLATEGVEVDGSPPDDLDLEFVLDPPITFPSPRPSRATPQSTPQPSEGSDPPRPLAQPTTAYYRTKDGAADYKFTFKEYAPGHWRAYIDEQPPYGGRPTGMHETHRLTDNGRFYVCWAGRLRSEQEVRAVAALWADNTQKYIATGRRF